jgi:hypothetical protein
MKAPWRSKNTGTKVKAKQVCKQNVMGAVWPFQRKRSFCKELSVSVLKGKRKHSPQILSQKVKHEQEDKRALCHDCIHQRNGSTKHRQRRACSLGRVGSETRSRSAAQTRLCIEDNAVAWSNQQGQNLRKFEQKLNCTVSEFEHRLQVLKD